MVIFFQPLCSYDPVILRIYKELEPIGIQISVKEGVVPLESLCIHTFSRIITCPAWDMESQIDRLLTENGGTLDIICYSSLGQDGSSGHALYKVYQMSKKTTKMSLMGGSCIVSGMVPLQMVTTVRGKTIVIHSNVLVAAPDSVRPVKLFFEKETTENSQAEHKRLKTEAMALEAKPFEFKTGVKFTFKFIFALIDQGSLIKISKSIRVFGCPKNFLLEE